MFKSLTLCSLSLSGLPVMCMCLPPVPCVGFILCVGTYYVSFDYPWLHVPSGSVDPTEYSYRRVFPSVCFLVFLSVFLFPYCFPLCLWIPSFAPNFSSSCWSRGSALSRTTRLIQLLVNTNSYPDDGLCSFYDESLNSGLW